MKGPCKQKGLGNSCGLRGDSFVTRRHDRWRHPSHNTSHYVAIQIKGDIEINKALIVQ